MRRPANQIDKIFLRAPFAVHYRSMRHAAWAVEARPDYYCLFMLGGEMVYQMSDENGVLRKQDGLLLDPGKAASANAHGAEFLTLALSSSYVLDCAARTRLVKSGAIVSFRTTLIEQSERLARLISNLVEELTDAEAGQEIVVAALIEQIVVHLLRHHTNVRRSDELELSRAGLVDRRIRRAIELMHAHLNRDLPLEEIAAAAYLSPFHFSRVFKKLTGATPHAYLATLRAVRAQELLAETDVSITEVSARVGYTSPSHFTKAFRQSTGMTPRAFRAALVISPDSRRK
jgi:AraC family transcriptional regulator